jgi:hypothetical protein
MSRELRMSVASILRPPLEIVRFVFGGIYKLLFGRADAQLSRRCEQRLAEEIRRDLAFLFTDHGGRIVADNTIRYPLPFDYAYVVVDVVNLLFRFFRGRDQLRAYIAPTHSPGAWEDLSSLLGLIGNNSELKEFSSLPQIASVLKPNMHWLQENLSQERYAQVQAKMADIHSHERAAIRQWEAEINRTVR